MAEAPNLASDAFRGTAEAYARFRPTYPAALLDDLIARLPARQRLLDLACGPGRIGLALAKRFEDVWLLDLEPEMIEAARHHADRESLTHVRFLTGKAETLNAPPVSFDLITIGEAFHRLDQRAVAARAYQWLKPNGLVATMGGAGFLQGDQPWKKAILGIAHRYFPQGWATAAPGASGSVAGMEEVLRAAGIEDNEKSDYTIPHAWSVESIIGYLRSTSVCSEQVLRGRAAVFDAELMQALLAVEPSGRFSEQLGFGCTSARKLG